MGTDDEEEAVIHAENISHDLHQMVGNRNDVLMDHDLYLGTEEGVILACNDKIARKPVHMYP